MEISAQSILTVGGQSGPLQSLVAGLKPGDSLTAQILARTQGGLALVALAGKQVQFPLPATLSPGTLLTLTVQQGSDGLQFVIQPQNSPGQAAGARPAPPPLSPPPGGAPPAQISASGGPAVPSGGVAAAASPASAQAAQAASRPATTLPSSFSAAAPHLQAPLVNARTGLPVPAPQGAVPGQGFAARVLSTPTASTAIVSLGAQELPVSLPVPASPGTVLPLVVQAGPNGLQLAHAPSGATPSPAPTNAVLNQVSGGAPQFPVGAPPLSGGSLPATAPAPGGVPQAPAAAPQSPGLMPQAAPDAASKSAAAAVPVATLGPAPVLTQATLASLANQNSVAALFASVLRLGDRLKSAPDDVQRAVQRLGATILPLDTDAPSVSALQRSIARSGVFLESRLAAGAGDGVGETDLKALLITLRRTLGDWLGADAKPAVLAGKPPPPPQPGLAPRAPQPGPHAPLSDDMTPEDIGKTLMSQTDAALSRLRLHQIASLPDRPDALLATRRDIHLEVPVSIGQQPAVLSLVISHDAEGDAEEPRERNWRVQFAINASVIGEVGAEVGLLAGKTNVVLAAAQPQSAEALAAELTDLSGALEAVGLVPGILRVRRAATAPAAPPAAASGRFLDRDT